jgi:anti-sigma regulatory factor (Ser/Thr protein kinase)
VAVSDTLALTVTEASQTGEARRQVARFAARLGFDDTQAGKVAIVVTEVATNLVKHAKGGDLLVRPLADDGVRGVEILALDSGPGIANIGASLRDGYSTTGTPGTGLGAVMRLAEQFDVYSQTGVGTAVLARLWAGARPAALGRDLEIGGVCVPYPGETHWGDAWAAFHEGPRHLILVIDGLGHGQLAADACREALPAFRANAGGPPHTILDAIHGALKSTRGAAAAVVEIDLGRMQVRYAGVGNISAVMTAGDDHDRHLVSHSGILGHEVRRIDEFTYPWRAGGMMILHTDGLATRWDLKRYAGLGERHPSLIAGVLYRDARRGRDDVTVVVVREQRA